MPGHAKTLSVTIANAISEPNCEADHGDDRDQDVAQHVHADHARLDSPLARANFT